MARNLQRKTDQQKVAGSGQDDSNIAKFHIVAGELYNNTDNITITIIGAGGTGSMLLSKLVMIHKALIEYGRPGLSVTVMDSDRITEANIGRTNFFPHEIGQYKAEALVTRINRAFGLRWNSLTENFWSQTYRSVSDYYSGRVFFICTDTLDSRIDIYRYAKKQNRTHYLFDLGNGNTFGQVILGTNNSVSVNGSIPKMAIQKLSTFPEVLPDDFREDRTMPSCSLRDALKKQDLFINDWMAMIAGNLFWEMLKNGKIFYNHIYLNLSTFALRKNLCGDIDQVN